MTRKNWIVFSSPRTGSTIIGEILSLYLFRKHHYAGHLGEFFNPYTYNLFYKESDGFRRNLHAWEPGSYRETYVLADDGRIVRRKIFSDDKVDSPENETARRVGMLTASPYEYFLHVHAWPLHSSALDYVFSNTSPILTERRDRWQQILSYGLAYGTKIFRATRHSRLPNVAENSIIFPRDVFLDLVGRIKKYDEFKARLSAAPVVCFEDFLEKENPMEILADVGFPDWFNFNSVEDLKNLSQKTFPDSKERYFSNLQEMRALFADANL